MAKTQTVRFAAGSPDTPFSGVWRLVVSKDDVFIGASKDSMGIFKISLHKSGVWVLAATQQSGATFQDGNRRAKRWNRPLEHSDGITRGPSILVPHTSLGPRCISRDEIRKKVQWYMAPSVNETVEFSLYFVDQGAETRWISGETVMAECALANGGNVTLLASIRPSPTDFKATVERLLKDNVIQMDNPSCFKHGSFLWVTESRDHLAVPLIIDLPVPIQTKKNFLVRRP